MKNLPGGKKGVENKLKLQVLESVKILFPSDKIKELRKYYKIKEEKNQLVGINESLRRRKVVVSLSKDGLIDKIVSYFPLNRLIEEYKYKKMDQSFFVVSKLEKNSINKENIQRI